MKRGLLWLIALYQRFLSPLKQVPTCKYLPTCSEYAKDAITNRGPLHGSWLAIWRILRCNPFSRGGVDPVPPKRHHRH